MARGTLLLVLVAGVLGAACSPSYPRLSFAVRERILRETTLEDVSEGKAGPGDGVVRIVRLGRRSQGKCSGAFVGPRQILTAQHCVVDVDGTKELTTNVASPADFHVELGGGHLPWGRSGVRAIHTCEGWQHDPEHDLAVVVIATPAPRDVPIFALDYGVPSEAGMFELDGFGSGKKPRAVPGTSWMVFEGERHVVRGPVVAADATRIVVALPGVPGDSGGPIVDMATGKLVSVASMATSDPEKEVGVVGPRLATCRSALSAAGVR